MKIRVLAFVSKLIVHIVVQEDEPLLHAFDPLLADISLLGHIVEVLGVQELEEIMRELFVALDEMDSFLGAGVDHFEVELVWVAEGGLLPHRLETILLGVVVARTGDVVLLLLEETILLASQGLGSLLVVAPVDGVTQGRHGELDGWVGFDGWCAGEKMSLWAPLSEERRMSKKKKKKKMLPHNKGLLCLFFKGSAHFDLCVLAPSQKITIPLGYPRWTWTTCCPAQERSTCGWSSECLGD